jgi:hypothetical protein
MRIWAFSSLCILAAMSAAACSGSDDGGGSGGSSGSGGSTSGCTPTDASCYIGGPTGPGAECMAKADFAGADVTSLRMSAHQVASPAALAAPFVQDAIITKRSTLNEPACNMNGSGTFNFLMQLDTAQKQVTIGGGVPQGLVGPATGGTCWVEFTDAQSQLSVKRETATYTEKADGSLEAAFDSFVMPIYLEENTTPDSYVLVPLHSITFTAKLSADKDCVGRYAADRLSPGALCQPAQGEFAWDTAGRYEGYITVEEADKVMVVTLGETLCVVLTGDPSKWKGTAKDCASSTGFSTTGALPKGDWCSTTNSAGGCQDSWKLVIDFAAQAIDIKGVYDGSGC